MNYVLEDNLSGGAREPPQTVDICLHTFSFSLLKRLLPFPFSCRPLWGCKRPHYSSELNSRDSRCQKDLSWLFTAPGNKLAQCGYKHSEGMWPFCVKAWPAHSSFRQGLCADLQVCVGWAVSCKEQFHYCSWLSETKLQSAFSTQ